MPTEWTKLVIGMVTAILMAAICTSTIGSAFAQARLGQIGRDSSPTVTNLRTRRLRASFGWICERRRLPHHSGAPGNVFTFLTAGNQRSLTCEQRHSQELAESKSTRKPRSGARLEKV